MTRSLPLLLAMTMLSACVSTATAPSSPRPAAVSARPAPAYPGPAAAVKPGSLMGRDARALMALFGVPRIDATDAGARRLQFAGAACVLDIYLYKSAAGREPAATHADARLPDGRDTAVDGCAEALRRR